MVKKYRQWRANGHSPLIAALAAPDITLVLGIAAAVGLIVGLSGCSAPADPAPAKRGAAQGVLDYLVPACRDGVQYLVTPHEAHKAVVPRMKLDGTLYRCSIKRETTRTVEEWEL